MTNSSCTIFGAKSHIDSSQIAKFVPLMVIGVLGMAGNIFILTLALKYTIWRNLHHLIVNMIMADLLIIFVNLSFWIPAILRFPQLKLTTPYNNFGMTVQFYLCKLRVYLRDFVVLLSLVTLLIISIERYKATRPTLQRSRRLTIKKRLAVLVLAWLFSLTIPSYELFVFRLENFTCVFNGPKAFPWYLSQYVLIIAVFCIILASTFVTLRRLAQPQPVRNSLSETQRRVRTRQTKNVVKLILCSLLIYSVCYIPFFTFDVIKLRVARSVERVCFKYNFPLDKLVLECFLPLIHSLLSPFVYVMFLSDFREAAKTLVRKNNMKCKKSRSGRAAKINQNTH